MLRLCLCTEHCTCGGRVRAGNCDQFSELIGSRGKDVLYIGDHIFGDILKSKKKRGWRTFIVVPELMHELFVWKERGDTFFELQFIDNAIADVYRCVSRLAALLLPLPAASSPSPASALLELLLI